MAGDFVVGGFAGGFASDDEAEPTGQRGQRWRPPQGYGELPGDRIAAARPTGQAAVDYAIRQNSSGPSRHKVRFIDVVQAPLGRLVAPRPSPAQTKPRGVSFQRHCALLQMLSRRKAGLAKSDFQLLAESHRFLRAATDDDGSWEARLALRYYERLFKEYVICDLAGYKQGEVGLRWRTEAEVLQGRGQFSCGHRRCKATSGLQSYEVDFKYKEAGLKKRALVKARLCEDCAYKLHYRKIRAERRRRRRAARRQPCEEDGAREAKRSKSEAAADGVVDLASESSEAESGAGERPQEDGRADDDGTVEGYRDEADRLALEALAWKGPDPEARTREDDFDDYLNSLLL